jgi:hypothetical protein
MTAEAIPSPSKTTKKSTNRERIARERTDFSSYVTAWMVRCRNRLPGWEIPALTHLSKTESASVALLKPALTNVTDPQLRKLMTKHIQDEERHAHVFEELLGIWEKKQGGRPQTPLPPPAGGAGRMNLMELIALFEIGELRGFQGVTVYLEAFGDDPVAAPMIRSVVRDERFHCHYTHHQMEKWKREGHAKAVEAARSHARKQDRDAFRRQVWSFLKLVPRILANELVRPFRRSGSAEAA